MSYGIVLCSSDGGTNMLDAQAVISLLVKKGIITKEEYLAEVKWLSDEMKRARQRRHKRRRW